MPLSAEKHPSLATALFALAALGASVSAWGQAGFTPGRVLDTIPDRKPALPPTPPEVIFPQTRSDAVHDPAGPRFTVNAFSFVGNTVYSEPLLKRVVERFVDLQLNLYDLNRAADAITRHYRDTGYPIARAIIPAQKVEKGVVRIEVIEGRIASVAVVNNERYADDTITARAAGLASGGLVTLPQLERSLLLMNDLPGLTARATLQPGAEFGSTDLVIKAEEKWFNASLSLDNRGRREVGEMRLDAAFDLHNPLSLGDQLSLRLIESQHNLLTYGRVGYSVPVGANGLRLGATLSRTEYRIGGDFAALGIDGDTTNYEFNWTYPYVRSRGRNMVFSLGGRRTETTQRTLGVQTSGNDITLATAGVFNNWIHGDSSATNLNVSVSGNGVKNPLGARQDAQFGKLDIDANHLRAATRDWDLFLRGNLVVSRDALADTEKFGLGGPDSVRGYRSSELRGDRGWLTTMELRRQFVLGNTVGVAHLFGDMGSVKARGFGGTDQLRAVGAGLTIFPHRTLRAKVEYARAVSDQRASDGKRDRVWFLLTGSL